MSEIEEQPEGRTHAVLKAEVASEVVMNLTQIQANRVEVLRQIGLDAEWVEFIIPDLGINMVLCPPGKILSGDQSISLTEAYWIGKYEVTQGEWEAMMGKNPSNYKEVGARAPVNQVSWGDCRLFCDALTERERLAGRLPNGFEYSLPTEMQWEYASQSGRGSSDAAFNMMCWSEENSGNSPHPVGQLRPNALGLHDMYGNVWEWVDDEWESRLGSKVEMEVTVIKDDLSRVFRGGSWFSSSSHCRYGGRHTILKGYRSFDLGFRIALTPIIARPTQGGSERVTPR